MTSQISNGVKIKILGSNGWYSTKNNSSACIAIETSDSYIVLDAGEGIYKLDEFVKKNKPIYLFLSHFHFDHIFGFHIFPKFKFKNPITIFGQPGSKKIINKIICHPFTKPLAEAPFVVKIFDLKKGKNLPPKTPFPVECRYLIHADPCFGFRLEVDKKIIAYCTDTGYCQNAIALAKGADIFITEYGRWPNNYPPDKKWPHLSPQEAALMAKRAKAKNLLLIHPNPMRCQNEIIKQRAGQVASKIFRKSLVARDNQIINI